MVSAILDHHRRLDQGTSRPFPFGTRLGLVQMFSFTGDTVLDPFCGTATTMVAALERAETALAWKSTPIIAGLPARYLKAENADLFSIAKLLFEKTAPNASLVKEDRPYKFDRPRRNSNRRTKCCTGC